MNKRNVINAFIFGSGAVAGGVFVTGVSALSFARVLNQYGLTLSNIKTAALLFKAVTDVLQEDYPEVFEAIVRDPRVEQHVIDLEFYNMTNNLESQ